jgi:predicted phosphodiesterase
MMLNNKKKWTQEEIEFLAKWNTFTPKTEVYQSYIKTFGNNRSYDSVQKKFKSLSEDTDNEHEQGLPNISNELYLAITGKRHFSEEEKTLDRQSLNDWVNETIEESKNIRAPFKISYDDVPVDGKSLLVLLSDTHFGKKTKVFSMEIARERIMSIPEKILDLGVASKIEEVVIMLAGDMIEGEDIYPSQAHHLECCVLDQVKSATKAFFDLGVLLREMGFTVRYETCPGNHGRMSKTAHEKSNWDNCIYQNLGMLLEAYGDSDLRINVNFNTFHVFNVQNKRVLAFHHGTKHLGTPAMQKKHAGWMHTKKHDLMVHGHWHQWELSTFLGTPVMKNGSLCGEDDLSERMGVCEKPRQGWTIINRNSSINNFGFFEWEVIPQDEGFGAAPSGYDSWGNAFKST